MNLLEKQKIRTGKIIAIVVPLITAILLSFGNDYIVMHDAHKTGVVELEEIERGMIISNLCLLIGLWAAIWISNRLFRMIIRQELVVPLSKLRQGMREIRHGNYGYRIEYPEDDPMYEVYDDFNVMATEMKRFAVKASTVDEGRKQLLLSISHDLRSPLTSIIAYVQGLIDGIAKTEEKKMRYLQTIKKKSMDIDKMVNRLFTYAKLDSDEYQPDLQVLDIGEYFTDYVVSVGSEYHKKNMDIELNVVHDCNILGDTDMLDRICNNLLENSCKYNDKEQGRMKITVKAGDRNVKITFADNGPGVQEEDLAHLWDIFYRTDEARKNPGVSNGIGLSIVKKAVELMHGKVAAENGKENGLKMIIRIPIYKEDEDSQEKTEIL